MFKNKKTMSVSILVLVLMALVLSSIALLTFITLDIVREKVQDGGFIERVYVKEEQTKFFVSQLVKDVAEDELKEKEFKDRLAVKAGKIEIEDFYLKKIKNRIVLGDYTFDYGDKISLIFKDFKIIGKKEKEQRAWWYFIPVGSRIKETVSVVYTTDLRVEVTEEKQEQEKEENKKPEVTIEKIGQYGVSKEGEDLDKTVSNTITVRGTAKDPGEDIEEIKVIAVQGGKNSFEGLADYDSDSGEWGIEWDTTKKSWYYTDETYKSFNDEYHVVAVVEDEAGNTANYDAYVDVYNKENEI